MAFKLKAARWVKGGPLAAVQHTWLAMHKADWLVTLNCEILGVSVCSYVERCKRKANGKPSTLAAIKRLGDVALLVHIQAIHVALKQKYAWPTVWQEWAALGLRVGK
jgi:hypothetical protein